MAGVVLVTLEEDFKFEEAVGAGCAFGLSFSCTETDSLFRGIDFDEEDVFRTWRNQAMDLGIYAMCLAGCTEWVENYFGGAGEDCREPSDFSALKAVLVRDGIVAAMETAQKNGSRWRIGSQRRVGG